MGVHMITLFWTEFRMLTEKYKEVMQGEKNYTEYLKGMWTWKLRGYSFMQVMFYSIYFDVIVGQKYATNSQI